LEFSLGAGSTASGAVGSATGVPPLTDRSSNVAVAMLSALWLVTARPT
jgi:hypothetical protein